MLTARSSLLDSSVYAPISESVVDATFRWQPEPGRQRMSPRIADFGCGTGYYTAAVARAHPAADVLVTDRSPVAARMAVRAVEGATGVVLDIWRPLPLRDGVVDIALNIFAPRNPSEYARVIREAGILVVVVPRENHLEELQQRGDMLSIPEGKELQVATALGQVGFDALDRTGLEYEALVDAAQRRLLTAMGPTAHHAREGESDRLDESVGAMSVTVSVEVLTFERRRPA
ncbi:methyltransferase domain-containing protein [Agromyces salentinus]|nr:methyltransferase domain-containing protein [Agromyces salentinus]